MNNPYDSQPPVMRPGSSPLGVEPTSDDRMWGLLVHLSPLVSLGIVGPLIAFLIYKDKSEFIADQAKEALNFHISLLLAGVVCGVTIVGLLLLPVVLVGSLIYGIIAGMEANKGIRYRYPYTLRLVK